MKQGHRVLGLIFTLIACFGIATAAVAQNKDDVFKGKLFPPNVILENQAELDLSKEQFTKIRAAVVEVQSNVAEHEWDMREAYLKIMEELDKTPIDEDSVIEHANAALLAENQVKKQQMAMLVRLKNLLTSEQIAVLEATENK
ncbi:MAG: hypothetical protein OER97_05675 [Gammaproteobacteria bacterium]|nr:hypothetical protein [Gammaproteobacteria bacterium]